MSDRLVGSGPGDLMVDRDRACSWAAEALGRPGVHLLVAEQGFGASVVVEHCRGVVPGLGVGRCHTGVLVPAMSPFLDALGLGWPSLAPSTGFVPSLDSDGVPERSVPWTESPASLIARMDSADAGRPFVVIDAHEALPPVAEVLLRLAVAASEGRSTRGVLLVAQPWSGRGHRVDWFEALAPSVTSRFDLEAATPDAAWAWFSAVTTPQQRPEWLADADRLWAATRGVPFLVGLAADPVVLDAEGPAVLFDLGRRMELLGGGARRVAGLLGVADLSPLPAGMLDRAVVAEMLAGPVADPVAAALSELAAARVAHVAADGAVRFTDLSWADVAVASVAPLERREFQVRLLERAIAAGAAPAMVAVHLADVGWSDGVVVDRLERAVFAAVSVAPRVRLEWLDLLDAECPVDVDDLGGSSARLTARLSCFAGLDRPSVGALTALRVDGALRSVEANPAHRGRRAMAYGRLVQGEHDHAIVELLDLREAAGRGQMWAALTVDLATVYLLAGRFALCERSAADAWADLRAEPAVRVAAGTVLATVRLVRGDLASAASVCDEVTVMLDLLDRAPVSPLPAHLLAAMVRFSLDQHAESLRLLEVGLSSAQSTGSTWGLAGHRGLAARVWLRQGRLATAERMAMLAADLPASSDGFRTEGWWAGVLGWVEWLRGGDPTSWLAEGAVEAGRWGAGSGVGVVRVGSEVLALVHALWLERSGDSVGAAGLLMSMFDATLGLGAVSALSEALPMAARLAVVVDEPRLRESVGRVLDIRSLGAIEVPSRRAEQWAAQAWLHDDVDRMRAALDRADSAVSMLLAAELASDGELLARRVGDVAAQRWFAEQARTRWTDLGLAGTAAVRAGRQFGA